MRKRFSRLKTTCFRQGLIARVGVKVFQVRNSSEAGGSKLPPLFSLLLKERTEPEYMSVLIFSISINQKTTLANVD